MKTRRQELQWTAKDLAARTGYSTQAIFLWEKGKFSLEGLVNASCAMGLAPSELLARIGM